LNNIDKDIEYVESRLRGQTIVSFPASRSTNYTHDINWRRTHNPNYTNVLISSLNDQQQTRHINHKYLNTQQSDETIVSSSKLTTQKSSTPVSTTTTTTNGSVKTVKSRIEKMKDQKAAKTLR
jgi:hypothetical protein